MSKPQNMQASKKEPRQKLSNYQMTQFQNTRIIKKNLIYVIGIPSKMAKSEILEQKEYFGQYGTIVKVVLNSQKKFYNKLLSNQPTYSAYITYSTAKEASFAILSADGFKVDEFIIRVSYGSTKYCANFLRNLECVNKECNFFHYIVEERDILSKDEDVINESKVKISIQNGDIFNQETRNRLKNIEVIDGVLPHPLTLYERDVVIKQEVLFKKRESDLSNTNGLKSIFNKLEFNKENNVNTKLRHNLHNKCNSDIDYLNVDLKILNDASTISTTSESACSSFIHNSNNINYLQETRNKSISIFTKRHQSRFSFCESDLCNEEVPQEITEIINSKCRMYPLYKNVDLDCLESQNERFVKSIKNENWSCFLNKINEKY